MSTSTCPYCRTALTSADRAVTCTSCGLTYHQECWRENGGCAAYGCRGGGRAPAASGDWDHPLVVDFTEGEPPAGTPPAPRAPSPAAPRQPRSLLSACCEVGSGLGALIGVIAGGFVGARDGMAGFLAGAVLGLLAGLLAGYVLVPMVIVGATVYFSLAVLEVPIEAAVVIGVVVGGLVTLILALTRVA